MNFVSSYLDESSCKQKWKEIREKQGVVCPKCGSTEHYWKSDKESDLLREELQNAPEQVRTLLDRYSAECFETVMLTRDAEELANRYITEKVIGQTSLEDCQHIAIATVNKVDILASWNFKHIVNINKIRGYNGVNIKTGYAILEIRNPKDLIKYEND